MIAYIPVFVLNL